MTAIDSMGMSRRDALLAGFGGLCLCCVPALGFADAATVEEVASGLFVRRGVDQDASAQNLDAIANIGFIVGKDAVLVTDTGGSLVDGKWLRTQIKAKTDKPIKYVVISHVHPDHTFGAGAFVDDKPAFIGHAKLAEALRQRGAFYKKGLAAIIGADKVGPVVMPTKTIADIGEIDLGDRVISFKAHGPAHTTSDLSMLDKQSGLLLPADLLFVEAHPLVGRQPAGLAQGTRCVGRDGRARARCRGTGRSSSISRRRRRRCVLILSICAMACARRSRAAGSIETAIKSVGQDQASKWGRCLPTTMAETSQKPIKNWNGSDHDRRGEREDGIHQDHEPWRSRLGVACDDGAAILPSFAGVEDSDQQRASSAGRTSPSRSSTARCRRRGRSRPSRWIRPKRAEDAALVPITITLGRTRRT